MTKPEVSVILTSYNHAAYIAAAIESVLNQTFADFELLIIDDGSRDNSREIIKTFGDPRIKTFLYEKNRGPVLAIRDAVNSAQGKYIAVHHSDDLWASDKLEKQVAFLNANKAFAACFTRVEFIDEFGNVRELDDKDFYKKIFEQNNRPRAEWLNYFFYNANCLCHPSAMVRREAYKKFHLLELNGFWQLPVLLMWIRLCFHAEIFILQERLTKFRLRRTRQENTSATSYEKLARADLEFYFIAQEFVYNFTDDKFFLEVFPDAEKFVINGQINRRFAFAKICLAKKNHTFQLAGLELLKKLLSSPSNAAEIQTLYGYDEKSFLLDGGTFDVFGLAQRLNMLRAEIFIDDGDGFKFAAEKIISVDAAKKFYGRMDFEIFQRVNRLRFDPDKNFISLKINRVLINGKPCENFYTNAGEIIGDFYRFWTDDPQIIFRADLFGRVTFEIFGELEGNFFDILIKQNQNLHEEIHRLNEVNKSILNSNSWKITAPLRNFNQWRKFSGKEKIISVAKFFYKRLPIDEVKRNLLKGKFYATFAPLLKDTQSYKNWQASRNFPVSPPFLAENSFDGELSAQPGKIAIQAHIFYLDLLNEMVSYCKNMPYKFDALISVVDENAAAKVESAFTKIKNAEKVIVRVVPNRGRDVAPFLAGFGDVLPEYDFVAHIHSKKSLYSGAEQFNWRKYLFNALLGNSARIRKIFKAFAENESVGVIYPRPAANVPYAAFNWLSNREVGKKLLNQMGISPNKTDYFDFPAGTMFWARTRALKKFFNLGLTFEDFPPERGQNDGTLAHAFERSVLLAARAENMTYYEFDPDSEKYLINVGSKNFWQYYGRKEAYVLDEMLTQGEIISFDVFDMLIMRHVVKPHHVKEIVQLKLENLVGRNFDFVNLRTEAESYARQIKGGEVSLDEIYRNFAVITNLDEITCKKIRELEVSTELELISPRKRIVSWFKTALSYGKKVWLISDNYLQTPDIERLLKKCGVEGYEKLLISCETGMRKDTAEIWKYLAGKNLNSPYKLTHLGENEMSDIQIPGDMGFGQYHLMSAINLFSQIPFGRNLLERLGYEMSLHAGIFLGVILAKKFHDPFKICTEFGGENGRLVLKNLREIGYWLYGVPVLTFILQKVDGVEKIDYEEKIGDFSEKILNVPDDEEICGGIKDFCRAVLEIFGDIILRVPIDKNFVDSWVKFFLADEKIIAPEFRGMFIKS